MFLSSLLKNYKDQDENKRKPYTIIICKEMASFD